MLFVGSIARFTLHISRQQGSGDKREQEYGFEFGIAGVARCGASSWAMLRSTWRKHHLGA